MNTEIEVESNDEATENETPRERFLRLAPARTEKTLQRIKQLGNCAGHGYEYTPEEAQQIMDVLFDAVHDLKRKFEGRVKGGKKSFAFKRSNADEKE